MKKSILIAAMLMASIFCTNLKSEEIYQKMQILVDFENSAQTKVELDINENSVSHIIKNKEDSYFIGKDLIGNFVFLNCKDSDEIQPSVEKCNTGVILDVEGVNDKKFTIIDSVGEKIKITTKLVK